jgi:acetyltransferase-like isoleucine patch superfamily enzyme
MNTPKPLWKRLAGRILHSGLPVPRVLRPLIRGLYRVGVAVNETGPLLWKLVWVEPVLRSVCESVGTRLRAERLPYMRGRGRLVLGDDVRLSGRSCFFFMSHVESTPEIIVGNNVFIGNGCTFAAARSIRIGNDCLFGPGVRVHDNDGHPLDPARRRRGEPSNPEENAAVTIGNGVWVAAQATILKGVTIGENAVVGAGAVVTADVPANSVVAGNPARVVRTLT